MCTNGWKAYTKLVRFFLTEHWHENRYCGARTVGQVRRHNLMVATEAQRRVAMRHAIHLTHWPFTSHGHQLMAAIGRHIGGRTQKTVSLRAWYQKCLSCDSE